MTNIRKIFECKKPSLSFEFFPPQNEKATLELYETMKGFSALNPSFVSVTYGAGGGEQIHTEKLLKDLSQNTNLKIVAHVTCINAKKSDIEKLISRFIEMNITNVMVLRGDLPKSNNSSAFYGDAFGFSDFKYAKDLVMFIKKNFPQVGIGVAGFPEGHPETPNRLKELSYLKEKVDAGADYICTQLFFDNHQFYDFRERCKLIGINIPIIAGVMPIISKKGMERMGDLAGGANFPAKLLKSIMRAEEKNAVENIGVHWAAEQVLDLLDNDVDGIHFYTLNKSSATRKIYETIGLQ